MKQDKFELPVYCGDCGVYLMGGATVHNPGCEFRKLIEENFPRLAGNKPAPTGEN